MKILKSAILFTATILALSCKKEDPTPETKTFAGTVQIVPNAKQIAVGDTFTVFAFYYDNNNQIQNVNFIWQLSDTSLVSFSDKQLITGRKAGILEITARFENLVSEKSLITIVGSGLSNTPPNNTGTGNNTFTGTVSGNNNETTTTGTNPATTVTGTPPSVSTTTGGNTSTVSGSNTVSGTNTVSGSNTLSGTNTVSGTNNKRTGSLSGRNNYSGQGTAGVELTGAQLSVFFESNFSVQNGPDLVVYLSNSETVETSSLFIKELSQKSGAHSYSAPLGTNLNDYNYVIIHCRAVNRAFAVARLQ